MSLKYPIIPRMIQDMPLSQLNPVLNIKKYQYTEGVLSHAISLGMDPSKDQELLWIAETSLLFPTPPNWTTIHTNEGRVYYYNKETGNTNMEHPFDDYFKYLFFQIKEGNIRNANETEEDHILRKKNSDDFLSPDQSSDVTKKCDNEVAGIENEWQHLLNLIEGFVRRHSTPEEFRLTDPEYTPEHLGEMVIDATKKLESLAEELGINNLIQCTNNLADVKNFELIQNELKYALNNLESEKDRHSHLELKYTSVIKQLEHLKKNTQEVKNLDEKNINGHTLREKTLSDELESVYQEKKLLHKEQVKQAQDDLNRINTMETKEKLIVAENINSYERAKITNLEQNLVALSEKNNLSLKEVAHLKNLMKEALLSKNELSSNIRMFVNKEQDWKILRKQEEREVLSLKEKCNLKQQKVDMAETKADIIKKELDKMRMMHSSEKEYALNNLESEKDRHSHLVLKYASVIKQLEHLKKDTQEVKNLDEKNINELTLREKTLSDELESVYQEKKLLHKEQVKQKAQDDLNRINTMETKEKLIVAEKINSYERAKITNLEQNLVALSEKNNLSLKEIAHLKNLMKEALLSKTELSSKIRMFVNKEQDWKILRKQEEREVLSLKEKCNLKQKKVDMAEAKADMIKKELDTVRIMYSSEKEKSKSLNNKIIELQGNIKVFCRIRPLSTIELRENNDYSTQDSIKYIDNDKFNFYGKTYEFDKIFNGCATQENIFNELSPSISNCMDGHRVCIFTYGATGSGKTFTMEGTTHDRGVIYRSFEELFKLAKISLGSITYTFLASVVEVYNETIHDLLTEKNLDTNCKKDLSIHLRGTEIQIDGLTEREISCLDQVENLLELASENRVTATNNINEFSSRSHLILVVKISSVSNSGERINGKLNLIDLAGNERLKSTLVEGKRLKEAQSINSSLSSLGDVIAALGNGSRHVPYRNSKLTYILQDSLKSCAKVLMFVNINPIPKSRIESTCSLSFASRCRAVQLGVSKREPNKENTQGSPDKKRLTRRTTYR